MLVSKIFSFDAAHKLAGYNGPCSRLHGHTYKLEVAVTGTIKKDGIAIDFEEIKKTVQKKIISRLDHTYLNKIVKKSTAENITVWVWKQLEKDLNLYEIKLWETPTSFVAYKGGSDT